MTQAEAVETKVQGKRERRSWAVVMEDGAGARLEVRLERRKDGWRTLARHVVGSGKARKVARGVTEQHADEASAKAAQAKVVAAAEKSGWKRREARGGGFVGKPDAFTLATLPKPASKK